MSIEIEIEIEREIDRERLEIFRKKITKSHTSVFIQVQESFKHTPVRDVYEKIETFNEKIERKKRITVRRKRNETHTTGLSS